MTCQCNCPCSCSDLRPLTDDEIATLKANGCSAEDFGRIRAGEGFDATRVARTRFVGDCVLSSLEGDVALPGGPTLPAGISDATLVNCHVGRNVYIHNVGRALVNYRIGDAAVIDHVDLIAAQPGATFGNGVEVEAVNEKGGREVIIFNDLSAQIAYLSATYRHRSEFMKKLNALAEDAAKRAQADMGCIGAGAVVTGCGEILDVCIGAGARVNGVAFLRNGTILSDPDEPTVVGDAVQAEDFIIGRWSKVEEGAILSHVFVGEGCRIGKQYSAENCLFFANCEGFHGEAVALFAGPYTVTHHKSTLLIAGVFSFYNAGSGTNQSNHMYKVGPVHQGLVERGCKTGSFAYMLWPCRVGAFSVVMDKHGVSFDLGDFPFSYVTVEGGKSTITPGMNMMTVAIVRDEQKWRDRDRRGEGGLDLIHVDTFSPYTVGKMIRGRERLLEAAASGKEELNLGGAWIKRILCKKQARTYEGGIKRYLYAKLLEAIEKGLEAGDWKSRLAAAPDAVLDETWVDVGGLLAPRSLIDQLMDDVESGAVADMAQLRGRLQAIYEGKDRHEWAWARWAFEKTEGKSVDALEPDDVAALMKELKKQSAKFTNALAKDAEKEYDESSRLGFAPDHPDQVAADFAAVRGTLEEDSFVNGLRAAQAELEARIDAAVKKVCG